MTSSKASPAWPGFVRCVALAGAAALAAGLAVTLLVDPFWVFRDAPPWLAWTGGVNRHLDLEMRRAKPLQLLSRPADTVLVGSSTVYRGLDPADVAGGTYNLGLSSLMADELPLVARLIVARGDVRSVVIGLDYFSFSAMAGPPPLDPALAGRSGRAAAWLSAALSLRALAGSSPASIRAALEPGSWRRDGFKTTPDYPPAVTRRLLRDQEAGLKPYRRAALARLEEALLVLRGRDVRLYLSPASPALLAAGRRRGNEPDLDTWRAEVAALAARLGLPLLDLTRAHPFADFDPDRGSSEHWLDGLHFKPEVGRWILQLLGVPGPVRGP